MFNDILKTIYDSPRLYGGNNISDAGDFTSVDSFSVDNPTIKYFIGLMTPFYFLIIVFFIWSIFWCVGCYVNLKCFKNKVLVVTLIITGLSFLVFLSLGTWGVSLTNTGVDNFWKDIDSILDIISNVNIYTSNIVTHAESGDTLLGVAKTVCLEGQPGGVPSFPDISTEIINLKLTVQDVKDALEPVKESLKDLEDEYNSIINIISTSVIVISIFLYLLVLFFVGTSTVRVYKPSWEISRFNNKTVEIASVTVGLVVIILLGIVSCTMAVAAMVGSDICVPGADNTINAVLNNLNNNTTTATFCNTSPYDILCYYQTCDGVDPLMNEYTTLEIVKVNLDDAIQKIIDELPDSQGGFNKETCEAQLEATQDKFEEIDVELSYIKSSMSCNGINPIIRNLVDNTFCSELAKGSAVVYTMGYTSVMVFIVMLTVHFLLDFKDYDQVAPGRPQEFSNDEKF